MTGNAVVNRLFQALEIFVKVTALNAVWLLFTVLGLGVFGFFPAAAALLAVVRKWLMEGMDIPLFRTFAASYKSEFVKANLYGFLIVLYGWVLFVNYQYMQIATGWLQPVIAVGFIITAVLFLLTVTFLFPSLVHFRLSFAENIKFAFLLGVTKFYLPVLAGAGLMLVYHAVLYVPGILGFFIPSMTGLILMSVTYLGMRKVPVPKQSPAGSEASACQV
ncbi:YesL family protein [Alteribacter natronophilus]|uniref:YesL family protein n=1 Tax=Alteribacter natronophilus TaxID=2583810 RepID=UPI00110F5B05|nr:DUF624 domain-containing protein [Alteribacter natronophilus]TMW70935.1 DUF624 domain-containing protein [Alteribacter natronophilus]